uniref:EF-hand domain-containing protein n=1 Tax=Ciona savignyi TaxID=51511 RepID=H2ZJQ3_CIOSA
MSMGNGDIEQEYRPRVMGMIEELQNAGTDFTVEVLAEMNGAGGEDDGKIRNGDYSKALAVLDRNGDGKLTAEEVEIATWDQLRAYAKEIEPHEPSNSYELEYSLISYDDVVHLLRTIMRFTKVFTRKAWNDNYVAKLHGTKDFANEIFTGLVDSEDINEVESSSITEDVIKRALKNWLRFWVPQYASSDVRPDTGDKVGTEYNNEEPEEEPEEEFEDEDEEQDMKEEL